MEISSAGSSFSTSVSSSFNQQQQQQQENLIRRQQEFEHKMLDRGAKRFRDQLAKDKKQHRESSSGPGHRLLLESIVPVAEGVSKFIEGSKGKRGRPHIATKIFDLVGPDVVAYLTAKAILDSLTGRATALRVTLNIAGYLIDELKYRKFHQEAPHLFEWKLRQFNTTSYAHMKRSMDASLAFAGVDCSEFDLDKPDRIHVGTQALDIFVDTTGYVEILRVTARKSKETYVVPTPTTMEWIDRCCESLQFMSPVFMPTLIPPKPWSNTRDGGYWFALSGYFPLMRTEMKAQLQDLDTTEMPEVFAAINTLQETAWRINEGVFDVIERMKVLGKTEAGIPSYTDEPLPPKPEDIDENEESRKNWRRQAHQVYERNYVRKTKAIAFTKTISTAKTMLKEVDHQEGRPLAFFYPYNLDFRGRTYAMPAYLHPQGDDVCRGLLQFASGKPLGTPEAADWLAIHGANCLADAPDGSKLDKLPFGERISWIEAHTEEIQAVAVDPYDHDWWVSADKPLQFLAFCFEWAGYQEQGLSFESAIPVAMDGSCNGLQHYSALLRDPVGGKAVNLVPSDRPSDIYQQVADRVNEKLDADSDNPLSLAWIKWGKVDRKFCKRPVMTLPYGARKFGFKGQIKEFLKGLDAKDRPEFYEDGFEQINHIAGIIWEALGETVVAAIEGMGFFQKVARLLSKDSLPISWTTPVGLPVVQCYPKTTTTKRVTTELAGQVFKPRLQVPITDSIDANRQANGIAPNIIHSFDAAAMMKAVNAGRAEGLTHFAMIHDSFGTHAADAEVLYRVTREEFVRIYQDDDVLFKLEQGLMQNINIDTLTVDSLPARPNTGDLEVECVLESPYFFA